MRRQSEFSIEKVVALKPSANKRTYDIKRYRNC